MAEKPGTIVAYPEDLKWEAVGLLDENGKGIFVSLLYGDLKTKGPANFPMKYSTGVEAPPHIHSGITTRSSYLENFDISCNPRLSTRT